MMKVLNIAFKIPLDIGFEDTILDLKVVKDFIFYKRKYSENVLKQIKFNHLQT